MKPKQSDIPNVRDVDLRQPRLTLDADPDDEIFLTIDTEAGSLYHRRLSAAVRSGVEDVRNWRNKLAAEGLTRSEYRMALVVMQQGGY